ECCDSGLARLPRARLLLGLGSRGNNKSQRAPPTGRIATDLCFDHHVGVPPYSVGSTATSNPRLPIFASYNFASDSASSVAMLLPVPAVERPVPTLMVMGWLATSQRREAMAA